MTKEEAIRYIDNYTWSTMRLGLDRTRELLHRIGDPQKKLKFIHVAGSNGKGSTCAMLDAVLREAGFKTGLYTSPFIQDFCERMQVNGENIPGDVLADITEQVRIEADAMEDHPSQFELVTAIAMQYFLQENCDIVVLEVGLGGLMDSTNAIDAPEVAVITNIGLEHTEYLGNTISEIARNKAGIIKPGCSVVCYDGSSEAVQVVRETCEKCHVPMDKADLSKLKLNSSSLEGQVFSYGEWKNVHQRLLGDYQLRNASVVLETVSVLRQRGWNITDEAVRNGLKNVVWPARMEVMNTAPLFLLDGGHNPQCAGALAESLHTLLPNQKFVFLVGVLADKDYPKIFDEVAPLASHFVCLTPFNERALPGSSLADYLNGRGLPAESADSVADGIRRALELAGEEGSVVSFGSLYLAGAVRTEFHQTYRNWLRHQKIHRRDSLEPEFREEASRKICEQIMASEEYKRANTILLYRAVRGEVSLDVLWEDAKSRGKRCVFPLCVTKTVMEAYDPKGENAWKPGAFHIPEPDPENSMKVSPNEIDLCVCPLTVFDENAMRMGMGAGYYDRFLPKCTRADIVGVAFEAQKAEVLPADPWDRPMDIIYTEKRSYPK